MRPESDRPFALSSAAIRVDLVRHPAYLEAVVSGFKSPAGAVAVVTQIGEALRDSGLPRVLIDTRAVIGQMASTDHANVGRALAHQLGKVRCAVVARADGPKGEIAPAARAGGTDYEAFDDVLEATEWLLEGVENPQAHPLSPDTSPAP